MRRLTYTAAAAATLVLAACNDGLTDPSEAPEDDYALVVFGSSGAALENTLGPQGNRPFDGRSGAPRLPEALRLTDEQKAAIEALRDEFEAAHAEELAALKAIFEEAKAARESGATREEVRAILQEGRPIGAGLHAAVEELHAAIKAVFTAEQLAWLEAHRRQPPRDLDGRRRPPPGPSRR